MYADIFTLYFYGPILWCIHGVITHCLLQMVLVTRSRHRVSCLLVIRPWDLVMSFILLKCGAVQVPILLFSQVHFTCSLREILRMKAHVYMKINVHICIYIIFGQCLFKEFSLRGGGGGKGIQKQLAAAAMNIMQLVQDLSLKYVFV